MADQFGTYDSSALSRSNSTVSEGDQLSTVDKPRVKPEAFKNLNKGEAYINVFLTGDKGVMQNKKYKVRFPLPQTLHDRPTDWPQMPEGKNNSDCEGLNLWNTFMNEDNLNELKKQVFNEALGETVSDDDLDEITSDENEQEEEYI